MSSQPISGAQYKAISGGVGTIVISDSPAVLERVFYGGTYSFSSSSNTSFSSSFFSLSNTKRAPYVTINFIEFDCYKQIKWL
jgi:hypothetical protein